jgi:hypothetical protein
MPSGVYQEKPLIYRIDVDPSERFPIQPDANAETAKEYADQLKIATTAVQVHIGSLTPVVNQIGLGSDARPQQDGGAAICCDASNSTHPACECNPENMKAFVCSDTTANLLNIRRAATVDQIARLPQKETQPTDDVHVQQEADETMQKGRPNVILFFIDDSGYVRCSFLDRELHLRILLVHTLAGLKPTCV